MIRPWTHAKKLALFADTGSRIVLHRLTMKAKMDRMVHAIMWGDWRAEPYAFDGLVARKSPLVLRAEVKDAPTAAIWRVIN